MAEGLVLRLDYFNIFTSELEESEKGLNGRSSWVHRII